ncbi:uncharacterized protein DS421_13g392840 [Arachis hypogaea]|nr:uncharacterized protein DS421_13g392840 [Arachis hypogaea]
MTEDDLEFTRRRTLMHERRCVVCEGKRLRARVLEEGGIHRRLASLRVVEMVPATQLVRVKSLAPTLASNHGAMTRRHTVLQRHGTRGNQIAPTTYHGANAFSLVRRDGERDVETVHHAHAVRRVVAGAVVDLELG